MLPEARILVDEIAVARATLIRQVEHLTSDEGAFKPTSESWSAAEVVEHLVWAEHAGLSNIMIAMEAWRRGDPVWTGHNPARDETIDTIIENTWQPKETAPSTAEPTWGGPLDYWLMFLGSCQQVVEDVAYRIQAGELDEVVYPHFISGPLTLRQRLGFLRYHMEHHLRQVNEILRALPA